MGNFITGTVVQNNAGAEYEGTVYDRRLVLHLLGNQELFIFDPAEPISTELSINESYELVLIPFVVSVQIVSAPSQAELPVNLDVWQGTVIDTHWKAPKEGYRFVRPDLYEKEWILLATALGNVLLNPKGIKESLSEGMVVQWKKARIDLYAII
jgi:hypothetical protein